MERRLFLVCVLALSEIVLGRQQPLKIAAFNVQVFGRTKLAKPEVVDILKQIVHRYDIILIQEIRDVTETTIPAFTDIVNDDSDAEYGVIVSERLGRTSSKEQYAFLYRSAVVEVVEVHQYDDQEDVFEREPFSVLFRTMDTGEEFFLMGIHVRPSDVVQELEALGPAFQQASEVYGSSRGTILGDMNAGCSYLSRTRYNELSLVNNPSFMWLLGYDADTTVASSSCPYDRIIVHKVLNGSLVEESATIFNFTEAFSLSAGQAANVSDHFPVEFQLDFQDAQASNHPGTLTPDTTVTPDTTTTPDTHSHSPPEHIPTITLLVAAAGLVVVATGKHIL
jgi:endonuclease/exonuclease/phosphatase family metal-dependent hydrolase